MSDDASLRRFLAGAAPLRDNPAFDTVRTSQLLSTAEFDGDEALAPLLDEARRVVAVAAPTNRDSAIARYALERVAIAVEERLRSAVPAGRGPFRRDRH